MYEVLCICSGASAIGVLYYSVQILGFFFFANTLPLPPTIFIVVFIVNKRRVVFLLLFRLRSNLLRRRNRLRTHTQRTQNIVSIISRVAAAVALVVYGFCRRAVWSVAVTTVTGSRAPDPCSTVVTKTIAVVNYITDTLLRRECIYYMIYDFLNIYCMYYE